MLEYVLSVNPLYTYVIVFSLMVDNHVTADIHGLASTSLRDGKSLYYTDTSTFLLKTKPQMIT